MRATRLSLSPVLRVSLALTALAGLVACGGGGGGGAAEKTPPARPVLVSTTPPSPANLAPGASLVLSGTAVPNAAVALYPTPDCSGLPSAAPNADATGAFQVALLVPADSTTAFSAKATTADGTSACSIPRLFVEDSTPPLAPVLGTSPGSPSNTLTPLVGAGPGSTEPGAIASVFLGPGCAGALLGTGTVQQDGSFGVTVTVGRDATFTFSARVTDAAGNASGCSAESASWVQDSTAPAFLAGGTAPGSPANENQPRLVGTSDPGSVVRAFLDAACAVAAGTGAADGAGLFAVQVSVADDTTTRFFLQLEDPAGNVSACFAGPTYVEDSTAPAAPLVLATLPPSPSPAHVVTVSGTAEAGARVTLFDGACDGPSFGAPVVAGANGAWQVVASGVRDARTTPFVARAVDAAGNASACSAPLAFVQTAPPRPVLASTSPASPANLAPGASLVLKGTAAPGGTVTVYANATCADPSVASVVADGGGAFQVSLQAPADAATAFAATDTTPDGTSACSNPLVFVEDSTPPAVPVLGTSPGSPSNTLTPLVGAGPGATEPGATARVFSGAGCNGAPLGTTTVLEDGSFAVTVTVTRNAAFTFSAEVTDGAGNASGCSAPSDPWVQDSTPPALAAAGMLPTGPANFNFPRVSGRTDAGSAVLAFSDPPCTVLAGSGGADGAGLFEVAVEVPDDSTTAFWLELQDPAGNFSACLPGPSYVEDSTGPAGPVIASTTPASPSNAVTVTVKGTAEPLAQVTVFDGTCDGVAFGTAVLADAQGNWEQIATGVLVNATTSFVARAVDIAGNPGACGAPFDFVQDSTPPDAPGMGTSPGSPSFDLNPSVGGFAEAGATVAIYRSIDCSEPLLAPAVPVDDQGLFLTTLPVVPNTPNFFSGRVTDRAGNTGACGFTSYLHDNVPPAAPAFTAVNPVGPANENAPVVTGLAEKSSAVEVFATADCSGAPLGVGTSDGAGVWAVTAAVADDTTTTFHARAIDVAGNVGACSPAGPTYVEDSTPPAGPSVTAFAPTSPSRFGAVVVSGTTDGTAVEVTLFRDAACAGITQVAPAAAVTGTTWSIPDPTVRLNVVTSYAARARDAAGNLSACGPALAFTSDQLAPAAPTLRSTPGSPSNTTTLTLSGAAEAGARVRVFASAGCASGELTTGGGTLAAGGAWSFPATPPLDATTAYSAHATDAAGNTSGCTDLAFTQDATPPAAPVLTSITPPGGPSNNLTPTVEGTAEAGATVRFYAGPCAGAPLLSAVTPDGVIFSQVPVPQNATSTIFADQVDPAGNVSACSATGLAYQHDGIAPAFAGLATAVGIDDVAGSAGLPPTGKSWVRLAWAAAVDEVPGEPVRYHVCRSTVFGACRASFANTFTTAFGQTSLEVAEPRGQRVFYMVRAEDQAGNLATNAVELSAKAFGSGAVATASGSDFTCVLDAAGRVTCQSTVPGAPQLGTGGLLGPVFGIAPGAVSVSAGEQHACALGANGGVYCWGDNLHGQVGAPLATTVQSTASRVTLPRPARAVACGRHTTCAVLDDGSVSCWGKNDAGQLGVAASPVPSSTPVHVTGLTGFTATQVAVGDRHACALLADGEIQCWGEAVKGQLGNGGGAAPVIAPAASFFASAPGFNANGFVGVATGWEHTCGWTATGFAWCSGEAAFGQVGDANPLPAPRLRPVQVVNLVGGLPNPLNGVTRLALGATHSCALLFDGTALCWGDDAAAQLGNGDVLTAPQVEPGLVSDVAGTLQAGLMLFASNQETCSIVDGAVTCWGTGGNGRSNLDVAIGLPFVLPGHAMQLAAGLNHTCAVLADGDLRCFGQGALGQLGGGSNANSAVPVDSSTFVGAVAAGGDTTAARGSLLGEARTWGSNSFLQLGDNDTPGLKSRATPGVSQLRWPFALSDHGCAPHTDSGTLSCWGRNDRGQVGNGGASATPVPNDAPTSPFDSPKVVGLAAGRLHTCDILVDGRVECWGDNTAGQLGGATGQLLSASRLVVDGPFDAVQVSSAGDTTCARLGDGTVTCWGANGRGQAGTGAASAQPVLPAATVAGLLGATDLAVGARHACAVRADGTVACWGANDAGQLGNGTAADSAVPLTVNGLSGVKRVVAGEAHTCALRVDGTARCWGGNATGQLGDGGGPNRGTPAPLVAFP